MTSLEITIREAFLQASSFLLSHEVNEHEQIAEILIQHIMGWDRTKFLVFWNETFPIKHQEKLNEMLLRKVDGEPVQYITGEQEFYGRSFHVNSSVLIPRPETELLIEQVILKGSEQCSTKSPIVWDIGTGSGCIAVTLAMECPDWHIHTTDISSASIEVAKGNARKHGVYEKINFHQGDLLQPAIEQQSHIDILISNPPYIPTDEIYTLQVEVQKFEPLLALDGGESGMMMYEQMIQQLSMLPKYPELIAFEVGMGQADRIKQLLKQCHVWNDVIIVPDLAKIDRMVLAY